MAIAKGLLSEDDYLPSGNPVQPTHPGTSNQYPDELENLLEIIEKKDADGMKAYLTKIQEKIK